MKSFLSKIVLPAEQNSKGVYDYTKGVIAHTFAARMRVPCTAVGDHGFSPSPNFMS
jgi:hypothetical protein